MCYIKWPSSRAKLGKRLVGNQQACAMAGGLYQDMNEEIRSDTTVPPTTMPVLTTLFLVEPLPVLEILVNIQYGILHLFFSLKI